MGFEREAFLSPVRFAQVSLNHRMCGIRRFAEPPIQKDYREEIELFTQNLSRSSSRAPRGAKSVKRMRGGAAEERRDGRQHVRVYDL